MLKTALGFAFVFILGAVVLANVARTSFQKVSDGRATPKTEAPASRSR